MRRKEIGEDLMQDNETYRKMRQGGAKQKAPRESPSRQSPDKQGYGNPEYERWTREELVEAAQNLDIADPAQLSREALIEALEQRELR